MKPTFQPGENIAIKVPPHQFEQTVSFYRDILGLEQIELDSSDHFQSVPFKFGDKNLWIDKSAALSQAEIWQRDILKTIILPEGMKLNPYPGISADSG